MALEVFRELTLEGDRDRLDQVVQTITASLTNGWSRDSEREKSDTLGDGYCFACSETDDRRAARLFLLKSYSKPDKLIVSNIVPLGRSLDRTEYNHVLKEFYDRFVEPAAAAVPGVRPGLSDDRCSLEETIGEECARLLKQYCNNVNRSVPHPKDQERWRKFLIAIHRAGRVNAAFQDDLLERWLIHEQKFSEDVAAHMLEDIESSEIIMLMQR